MTTPESTSQKSPRSRRFYTLAAVAAAIVIALAVVFTSVANRASSQQASSADSTEPKDGGEITFLLETLDVSWVTNASYINNYGAQVWRQITDKLVNVDENGEVTPWLAESWEVNDDSTQFTLRLKEGVTFSDGTPFDAAAVVKNIDVWAWGDDSRGISTVTQFPRTYFEKAEALDEHTVQVNFSETTLHFIKYLGYHGSVILAPSSIDADAETQADITNQIGTGPFVVQSYAVNDEIVLVKRDDYNWGPESHPGAAYLDKITYRVIGEESVRAQAVTAGQADIAFGVTPSELAGYTEQGFTVDTPLYLGYSGVYKVDTSVYPFDDVNVRQAVQHAIDRQDILDTIYTEGWQTAISFVQRNVPEVGDYSDLFEYNPDESVRLLDEAGWTLASDGYRYKDGEQLSVTFYPTIYLQTSRQQDELVAQYLEKIGIKTEIIITDASSYVTAEDYALATQTYSFVDIGGVVQYFGSESIGGSDAFNLNGGDGELDALLDELAKATSYDSRADIFAEIQQHVLQESYYIPIVDLVQRIYVSNPALQGVTYDGLAVANYAGAWLAD